jgi:hypothetical protein
MNYSNYPHGFSHGVSIKNVPVDITASSSANVYWVNSATGSNQNKGTFLKPFATLAYAITQCTADQGDKIYLSSGHSESVVGNGTITLNIAGVIVEFLGEGSDRATINFTTHVSASFRITGNNITVINPRFVAGVDALTNPISITGANCKIVNAEWYDSAAKAATKGIVAAASATNLKIYGYKYYASTTGTQKESHIEFIGGSNVELVDIDLVGDFNTANINNATSATSNVIFENIKLKNTNATPRPGMAIQAATTGMAKNVDIRIASGTTFVSSVAAINWDNNCLGYNLDGYGGDPIGTAATGSLEGTVNAINTHIGNPSGDTLATITAKLGDSTDSVLDYLDEVDTNLGDPSGDTLVSITAKLGNGATTVTADLASLKTATAIAPAATSITGAIGTRFWVKKTLVSSAIVQLGVAVTGVSSIGELAISQVILKTDATGLAGGTAIQLTTTNAKGAGIFAQETVANLGASATVSSPSAVNKKDVVEVGAAILAYSTVADCTGAGTIDIYIEFERLTAGATIAAA